ncbi:hypothetical protein SNE40_011064 [Patella caerulea]|uniref:Tubulin-specific chaperone E n=1 Tax=Patella caerulea TaxID=87958 RepID=A0AAN8Q0W9_PATCE
MSVIYVQFDFAFAELRRKDGSLVVVGDRIVTDDEHYATIKYIGEVPPTKGLWLGVDWDEPNRGKHDGTHNNIKYFTTRYEKSGSFVRPQKVNTGITFISAVRDRYGLKSEHDAGVITDELFVVGTGKTTVVEMVGAKSLNLRQSKLADLLEVDVKGLPIYGAGQDDLSTLTPNLVEVNLGKNLLSSWKSVAEIVRQLPKLTNLILSLNRLPVPKDVESLSSDFTHIKSLKLNFTFYTWQELLECSKMVKNLESLSFCFNSLSSLHDSTGYLNHLRNLAIENNNISSWKDVLYLGHLPRLETLSLNENQIDSIEFPDVDVTEKTSFFPKLKTLYILRNKISQWSSVNELNKLKSLCDVMMLFNPINDTHTPETVRQLMIAKISTLTLLSRTEILPEERKGSEIDYLKRFGEEWRKSGGSQKEEENNPSPDFIKEHPRYLELIKKWGAPEDSEFKQISSKLKDNLIFVKIACPQNTAKGVVEKKLPQTMTVQKVRALVQRLFQADASTLQLSYSRQKMEGPNVEMDNDLRQLSYYSIESGDTIYAKW